MPRVLVVDDDENVTSLFSKSLMAGGYEVFTASTSGEAISLFSEKPCDLVIIDIFMPEEGGLEVIRRLAKEDPRPRIIAVSGMDIREGVDVLEFARNYVADLTMEKPVSLAELLDAAGQSCWKPRRNCRGLSPV